MFLHCWNAKGSGPFGIVTVNHVLLCSNFVFLFYIGNADTEMLNSNKSNDIACLHPIIEIV
jgi:hypothetical protein